MLDLGESVGRDSAGVFETSSYTRVKRIVYWYLMQEKSAETRSDLLEAAVKNSTGIAMMEELILTDMDQRQKETDGSNVLLTDESLERLKATFIRRIERKAWEDTNELLKSEHLSSFLFGWRAWGEAGAAKEWVLAHFSVDEELPSLLTAFSREIQSGGFAGVVKKKRRFDLEAFEQYVERERLRARLREFVPAKQDQETQEIVGAVERALDGEKSERDGSLQV